MIRLLVMLSVVSCPLESVHAAEAPAASLWRKCQAEISPKPDDGFYRIRKFGRDAERSARITELIARGEKTVTFTTPWIYEGQRALTPVIGGYTVVNDFDGKASLILRTTGVKTIPYKDVDETDAQYEGPGVRTREAWRRVHWDFFTTALAPLGKVPTEDMPVTVERFVVVCSADAKD